MLLHPTQVTLEELIREVAADPDAFAERDAIERAVRDLARAGLLHRSGELVLPSRAALRFSELLGLIGSDGAISVSVLLSRRAAAALRPEGDRDGDPRPSLPWRIATASRRFGRTARAIVAARATSRATGSTPLPCRASCPARERGRAGSPTPWRRSRLSRPSLKRLDGGAASSGGGAGRDRGRQLGFDLEAVRRAFAHRLAVGRGDVAVLGEVDHGEVVVPSPQSIVGSKSAELARILSSPPSAK